MRTQWCREHIDEVAEKCDLSKSTVSDVKQAAKFCDEHSEISDCSTHAIMALIRIRDDPVRILAISLVKSSLHSEKKRSLTEREVKKIIERADIEVRKGLMKKTPDQTVADVAVVTRKEAPVQVQEETSQPKETPKAKATHHVKTVTTGFVPVQYCALLNPGQTDTLGRMVKAGHAKDMREAFQVAADTGITQWECRLTQEVSA